MSQLRRRRRQLQWDNTAAQVPLWEVFARVGVCGVIVAAVLLLASGYASRHHSDGNVITPVAVPKANVPVPAGGLEVQQGSMPAEFTALPVMVSRCDYGRI